MPRGYLKHNKEISKKKARGGSSGRGWIAENEPDPPRDRRVVQDFVIGAPNTEKSSNARKATGNYPIGECAICFENVPVVCLSNKCKWHAAACNKCLRRVYVTDAQKSTKSYPLKCFHPCCDQPVQVAQMEKHNLFASPAEVKKHHDMHVLSKIEKTGGMRTVYCPKCITPRGIKRVGDTDRTFGCNNCKTRYLVSPFYATYRALENMKGDEFGVNDGWANCPQCGIMISKGDGCSHMDCIYCGHEFDWYDAQEKKEKILHAIVPDREIYLW
eukprot:CAMPEP_0184408632 /NCGR_PEP_ID=MMETSP0738-20130409/3428_1 /TAXON_ID=385413 /ORGANISM="Thalassiosira miniscula, Strain CCMP1093" /LENGTH=271 /DNA_ID=CAMNT_0026766149 /DNA_START=134 /DNA_END=946 /DNA_ORIENTATION=+